MRLEIIFGALAPRIADQLKAANLTADADEIKHWQSDADAIARLNVRGILPDSAARNARNKLMRQMGGWVKNKPSVKAA